MQSSTTSTATASPTVAPVPTSSSKWAANDGFAVAPDSSVGITPYTRQLLSDIGGTAGIVSIVARFYEKFHRDRHLSQFLGGCQQPLETHAHRLGSYIAEMMGADGMPWHRDLQRRERKPIRLANGGTGFATDRMSAHYCAWNSIDRPAEKVGRRFKLDDCRVWMRLFFWAVRDAGYGDSHPLFRYLRKFIAHFIAIYENTARAFTAVEAAWSAKSENLEAYSAAGFMMHDVVDVPLADARRLSGAPSASATEAWLYDSAPLAVDD